MKKINEEICSPYILFEIRKTEIFKSQIEIIKAILAKYSDKKKIKGFKTRKL